jgi:hypothetical protein
MSRAIIVIALENASHDMRKSSHAKTKFRVLPGDSCILFIKKCADTMASKGLSPHINMNPMLEAKRTPVDERYIKEKEVRAILRFLVPLSSTILNAKAANPNSRLVTNVYPGYQAPKIASSRAKTARLKGKKFPPLSCNSPK